MRMLIDREHEKVRHTWGDSPPRDLCGELGSTRLN